MSLPDSFGHYLKSIGRVPLLTPAEEVTLGTQVRLWLDHPDGPDNAPPGLRRAGRRARDRMLEANLRLVVHLCKKYSYRLEGAASLTMDDLIQAGSIGLVRAVEKFDPTRGYKFSTYAYWWVRQSVTRELSAHLSLVSTPVTGFERVGKFKTAVTELCRSLGREPALSEIREHLGMEQRSFDGLLALMQAQFCLSLDRPCDESSDDSSPLLDRMVALNSTDPMEEVEQRMLRDEMLEVIGELVEPQKQVMEVMLTGESLTSWAHRNGIHKVTLFKHRDRAMENLREKVAA